MILLKKAKQAGVYDKLTFFFTTDHGMAPYGLLSPDESSDYGRSKIGELQDALKRINNNYILEMVASDNSPKPKTTVVGVGEFKPTTNLQRWNSRVRTPKN